MGIPQELWAMFVVGVIALFFVECENVVMKLVASATALSGILPLVTAVLLVSLLEGLPWQLVLLVVILANSLVLTLVCVAAKPPQVKLRN